ncbi:MAG: hypothetical protein ACPGXZ_06620 [Saprospiraceae bacterium]
MIGQKYTDLLGNSITWEQDKQPTAAQKKLLKGLKSEKYTLIRISRKEETNIDQQRLIMKMLVGRYKFNPYKTLLNETEKLFVIYYQKPINAPRKHQIKKTLMQKPFLLDATFDLEAFVESQKPKKQISEEEKNEAIKKYNREHSK